MNEIIKSADDFIGYDYIDINTTREMEGVYIDSYPQFGWEMEGSNPSLGISSVNIKFKRNRKIRNKAELSRLQRQFDSIVLRIEELQRSKSRSAFITAITIGLIGTAFLAGAVFAFIYAEMIPLMIILAIPGFLAWFVSYSIYKRMKAKKSTVVEPLIEAQYDAIYETCKKAHSLLAS